MADDQDLHNRFSVEVLTKAFYQELSDWHAWAIKEISFPNDIENDNDDAKFNHEGAIRLITRLIFVWFLKQRHLIPEEFFDEKYIRFDGRAPFLWQVGKVLVGLLLLLGVKEGLKIPLDFLCGDLLFKHAIRYFITVCVAGIFYPWFFRLIPSQKDSEANTCS